MEEANNFSDDSTTKLALNQEDYLYVPSSDVFLGEQDYLTMLAEKAQQHSDLNYLVTDEHSVLKTFVYTHVCVPHAKRGWRRHSLEPYEQTRFSNICAVDVTRCVGWHAASALWQYYRVHSIDAELYPPPFHTAEAAFPYAAKWGWGATGSDELQRELVYEQPELYQFFSSMDTNIMQTHYPKNRFRSVSKRFGEFEYLRLISLNKTTAGTAAVVADLHLTVEFFVPSFDGRRHLFGKE